MSDTTLADLGYRFCPAALAVVPTPHDPHPYEGMRCPGAPERDDRARTYSPKGLV